MSGSVSRPALLALSVLQSCSHPQHPALILTREGGTSRAGCGTQHPRGDRGRERGARAPCGVASGAGQQPDSIPATRFRLQGHRTCAGSGTEFSAQSRTFTINSDFGILLCRRVRRGLPRSSGERTSPRPRPGGRGAATGKAARSFPTPRHLPVSRPIGPRLPSLPHAARSGVPEHLAEVLDSRHSPRLFPPSFALPRPRPLRSAGVTRPLRYYEPIRHPAGPSWPSRVPGGRVRPTGRASRVATASLLRACCRHYPGGTGRCSRRSLPDRWLPSPNSGRVGFRITLFEACSTFTARCGLRAR